MSAIERPPHQNPQARAAAPAGLLRDGQGQALEDDDVVAADHALLFMAQDLVEVCTAEGHEGRRRIGGGRLKVALYVGRKWSVR